jgi:hypothetical protein
MNVLIRGRRAAFQRRPPTPPVRLDQHEARPGSGGSETPSNTSSATGSQTSDAASAGQVHGQAHAGGPMVTTRSGADLSVGDVLLRFQTARADGGADLSSLRKRVRSNGLGGVLAARAHLLAMRVTVGRTRAVNEQRARERELLAIAHAKRREEEESRALAIRWSSSADGGELGSELVGPSPFFARNEEEPFSQQCWADMNAIYNAFSSWHTFGKREEAGEQPLREGSGSANGGDDQSQGAQEEDEEPEEGDEFVPEEEEEGAEWRDGATQGDHLMRARLRMRRRRDGSAVSSAEMSHAEALANAGKYVGVSFEGYTLMLMARSMYTSRAVGISLAADEQTGGWHVASVVPGSAADEDGLLAGARLTTVNGEATHDLGIGDVHRLISMSAHRKRQGHEQLGLGVGDGSGAPTEMGLTTPTTTEITLGFWVPPPRLEEAPLEPEAEAEVEDADVEIIDLASAGSSDASINEDEAEAAPPSIPSLDTDARPVVLEPPEEEATPSPLPTVRAERYSEQWGSQMAGPSPPPLLLARGGGSTTSTGETPKESLPPKQPGGVEQAAIQRAKAQLGGLVLCRGYSAMCRSVLFWRIFPWTFTAVIVTVCHVQTLFVATRIFAMAEDPVAVGQVWVTSILIAFTIGWLVQDPIVILVRNHLSCTKTIIRSKKYQVIEKFVVIPFRIFLSRLVNAVLGICS